MQCSQQDGRREETIIAYAAGTLEPQARFELERHLAVCAECRAMAESQKALWEALEDWKPAPIPAEFNDRVYQRISEEEATAWWRRPLRHWSQYLRPSMPLAAACAALAIAFVLKDTRTPAPVRGTMERQVSIEQVERALDDMDLLKQLNAPAPAQSPVSKRI